MNVRVMLYDINKHFQLTFSTLVKLKIILDLPKYCVHVAVSYSNVSNNPYNIALNAHNLVKHKYVHYHLSVPWNLFPLVYLIGNQFGKYLNCKAKFYKYHPKILSKTVKQNHND